MLRAAMDVGTNSCRLLVAEVNDNQAISCYREIETTRVGRGVSASGCLDAEGMTRTILCLQRWSRWLVQHEVKHYQLVGTSAMREAANGQDFAREIQEQTGLELKIISGVEEARLSYLGVKHGLDLKQPPLVCDLGGGSTEFICITDNVDLRLSLPLGAVKAFDEAWGTDDIAARLAPIAKYSQELKDFPLVMVGGTATTLAAIDLRMTSYDWQKIQGYQLTQSRIQELYQHLIVLSLEERRLVPGLLPERADIIPGGSAIILGILQVLDRDRLMVADTDLLTALLWAD